MGFLDAFRRRPEKVEEERATYWAPSVQTYVGASSQVSVNHNTAAQSVAIRSTADLIASLTSELPITVYTGSRSKPREVPVPSNLEDPGGDGRGREDWMYRVLWSWLITGNTFGMPVDRDPLGRLRTVDIINGDQISPSIEAGKAVFYVNGKRADDLEHWRVNPVAGRLLGLSPIEHHAATIGVSLATTRFGREWFTDSAHPAGMLTNKGNLTEPQAEDAKQKLLSKRGTREPLVLGNGWEFSEIQISPEESQFLQTMGLSEAQCARIFGPGFAEILGYETGSKMTYANVVDRRQDLLVLGLNRWFRRADRLFSTLVPANQWVEINRDALLESTTQQRYNAHKTALDGGWRTINEVREIENLDPVDWGNTPKYTAPTATPIDEPDETENPDGNTAP